LRSPLRKPRDLITGFLFVFWSFGFFWNVDSWSFVRLRLHFIFPGITLYFVIIVFIIPSVTLRFGIRWPLVLGRPSGYIFPFILAPVFIL
jgi:hypothetical protein